jgi:hypothetical protein
MSLTKKDRIIRSVSGISFPVGGFADTIAAALHREYGATHAAVKTVVVLTGANERAVKNWFAAKNAPSGEFVVALCRHSDEVFEAFLLLAGREQQLKAKKVVDAMNRLREILVLLDELQST